MRVQAYIVDTTEGDKTSLPCYQKFHVYYPKEKRDYHFEGISPKTCQNQYCVNRYNENVTKPKGLTYPWGEDTHPDQNPGYTRATDSSGSARRISQRKGKGPE